MPQQRTILITGCSEGSLGDALARALHQRGQRVIATARNPKKMAHFETLGIETLALDVLSSDSIAACVSAVKEKTGGTLDILVNNAGSGYSMPLLDASVDTAREVFELNFLSFLAMIQAFSPLLLKSASGGLIANNTSIASVWQFPGMGVYNSSKAATAMMTDTLRLELKPLGIKVVELKTGLIKTGFWEHQKAPPSVPESSLYYPAKKEVERTMQGTIFEKTMTDSGRWAQAVAKKLLKSSPPRQIWVGGEAPRTRIVSRILPSALADMILYQMAGLNAVQKKLKKS